MRRQCKIFEKEGGKWCWRQRVVEVREYREKIPNRTRKRQKRKLQIKPIKNSNEIHQKNQRGFS